MTDRFLRTAQAVIFDMDGVIVDSEPRHEQAYLDVVRDLGYGETHGLEFANYVGRSDKELWVDFIARHNPPHSLEHLLALKRERVLGILRREKPLFDGLTDLVRSLAPKYSLGLASGSERPVIEVVLGMDSLAQYFSVVVSASEVAHGKPAPDIFLRTASLLGVSPAACWVVEDSKPGIQAALAAGMRVIAISNTHPVQELGSATCVVSTYPEISDLLLGE